jgi:hypothetical protein
MSDLHIRRRARNFVRQDTFFKLWLLPVWIGTGMASIVICIIPFRNIAALLGTLRGTLKPSVVATAAEEQRALQIGRTVRLAARYAPWRADCYPQAIVARLLLGLYGIPFTLSMGVRRDPATDQMHAHAWVQCGSVDVTGGDGDSEYQTVAVFSGCEQA